MHRTRCPTATATTAIAPTGSTSNFLMLPACNTSTGSFRRETLRAGGGATKAHTRAKFSSRSTEILLCRGRGCLFAGLRGSLGSLLRDASGKRGQGMCVHKLWGNSAGHFPASAPEREWTPAYNPRKTCCFFCYIRLGGGGRPDHPRD